MLSWWKQKNYFLVLNFPISVLGFLFLVYFFKEPNKTQHSFLEFVFLFVPLFEARNGSIVPNTIGSDKTFETYVHFFKVVFNKFGFDCFLGIALINLLLFFFWQIFITQKYKGEVFAEHGSAKLESEKTFIKKYGGKQGFKINQNFILKTQKAWEHLIVFGPTRSGKSTSLVIPNLLLDNLKDQSFVVMDVKGELEDLTRAQQEHQGKQVFSIRPLQGKGPQINFLDLCETVIQIQQLAQTLCNNGDLSLRLTKDGSVGSGDPFWVQAATDLFTSALIFAKASKKTIPEAFDYITDYEMTDEKRREDFLQVPDAYNFYKAFEKASSTKNTGQNIMTELNTILGFLKNPAVRYFLSGNSMNLAKVRTNPTTIYIRVPFDDVLYASPILSVLYFYLFKTVSKNPNGVPVTFLMDEFGNSGRIPSFETYVTTLAGLKCSITIFLQDIGQIEAIYKSHSSTILSNLKTKIVLPGCSTQVCSMISKMIGQTTIDTRTLSSVKNVLDLTQDSKNITWSKASRTLLNPDEIRRLEDETLLILTDNSNPAILKQYRYYQDPRMLALSKDKSKNILPYEVLAEKIRIIPSSPPKPIEKQKNPEPIIAEIKSKKLVDSGWDGG